MTCLSYTEASPMQNKGGLSQPRDRLACFFCDLDLGRIRSLGLPLPTSHEKTNWPPCDVAGPYCLVRVSVESGRLTRRVVCMVRFRLGLRVYERRRKRWNRVYFQVEDFAIEGRFGTVLERARRVDLSNLEWSIAGDSRLEVLTLILGGAPSG